MTLRKLAGVVPVMAALAIAGPVAGASAQTTAIPGAATAAASGIACYPYPAFCGPSGQPWLPSPLLSLLPMSPFTAPAPLFHWGPGPVQLP